MALFLIADDSEEKRAFLHALVQHHWKGEIKEAFTTEGGLAIAQQETIAAAFVDYYMPTQNGPALIAAIRALHPHCKIALASSSDAPENAHEAMAAGADVVLCTSKQSAPQDISDVLHQWGIELGQ